MPWSYEAGVRVGGLMPQGEQGHSLALLTWVTSVYRGPSTSKGFQTQQGRCLEAWRESYKAS